MECQPLTFHLQRLNWRVTMGKSLISRLFAPRCPAAISRFVIAVWVDAIKRQSVWLFTHVSEKGCERIEPSFANRDALSAVLLKLWNIRVETPRFHVSPTHIGRRYPPSPTMIMFQRPCEEKIKLVTSAACCLSFSQTVASNNEFNSTVAKTQPARCEIDVRKSQHGQTTETLSRDINEFGQWRSPFKTACVKWQSSVPALGCCAIVA